MERLVVFLTKIYPDCLHTPRRESTRRVRKTVGKYSLLVGGSAALAANIRAARSRWSKRQTDARTQIRQR
jgi:hypothetical protein